MLIRQVEEIASRLRCLLGHPTLTYGVFGLLLLIATPTPARASEYRTDGVRPGLVSGGVTAPSSSGSGAIEVVGNGGFELGLSSWSVWNQPGSLGNWFYSTGVTSPHSELAILAPAVGDYQGVADMVGPGTHIIYQDVNIPEKSTATLTLVLWYDNKADSFVSQPSLDYTDVPNQQVRVDVVDPLVDIAEPELGVLVRVFQSGPASPLSQSYLPLTASLDHLAGRTVRLRVAVVDNLFSLLVGVDAVSVLAEPPVTAAATSWGAIKARYRLP